MSDDRPKHTLATHGEGFDLDGDTIASRDGDEARAQVQNELQPGTQAGRYMILSRLGRGGMGVVYKAYDPELDRRVALKLLSVKAGSGSLADRARERLLREAKALAQLSHPNVVAAYDVGTLGQDVFVAMELVEGWTLKEWIVQKQPTVWEKVAVLQAAGLGIAAAHQAGLIHRDIKPDNIIVGQDGRVRVLDFGLARAAVNEETARAKPLAERRAEPLISGELTSGGSFLDTPMTQAGAIVGTPGYMAPEQYRGEATDAQTDQFSFCVTLYELLYGQRPWRAKKYGALKAKVLAGEMETSPAAAKVPASYRRIVMRGLSLAKQDRYGSMASLLAELGRDPRAVRRKWLSLAAVVLLVAGAFTGAYAWQAKKQQLCQGAESKLAGVWDQKIKQKVEEKFLATGRAYAKDTGQRVGVLLQDYAAAWVAMRTDACAATHVRGEQSARLLDLRMNCLDRRLSEMGALVRLFAEEADGQVVKKAVAATMNLSALSHCQDAEALTVAVPMPSDPDRRKRIVALRGQLHKAGALQAAGKHRAGLKIVQAIGQQVNDTDFSPLQAQVLFRLGLLESRTGDAATAVASLKKALRLAATTHNDWLRAKITIELTFIMGHYQERHAEALEIGAIALADVARVGNDVDLRASVLDRMGVILAKSGKLDQAKTHFEESLALLEKQHGAESLPAMRTYFHLANVMFFQGRYQDAEQHYLRTAQIEEKLLGPGHPDLGLVLSNLSEALMSQGKLEQALQYGQRSYAILKAALGEDNPLAAETLNNIGVNLLKLKRYAEARKTIERALVLIEAARGPEHPAVATSSYSLGRLALAQAQAAQALSPCRRAIEIISKRFGPEHPLLGQYHSCLGRAQLALGSVKPARASLERARAMLTAKGSMASPEVLAETDFALAKVLWVSAKDRARALTLAAGASDNYAAAGDHYRDEKEAIRRWLSRHSAQ